MSSQGKTNGKPRVCLIYTGGTIGMVEHLGILRPPEDPRDFLKIAPELGEFVWVDAEFLLNKDSTNVNPLDWTAIANAIYERMDRGYNGFVIAHGTDTMHFTASALALAFGPNLNCPIVVTGAQTNPRVTHGDARVNLVRAFRTALTNLAEVCICFGEYVFRGCRAQKKDERRFDAFESPAFPPLAYITETIDLQPLARLIDDKQKQAKLDFRPTFAEGVVQVSLIPGLEPEFLEAIVDSKKMECTGVVLQSFGAGNVPSEGRFAFQTVISKITSLGKPVVITSQFPANSTLGSKYQTHEIAVNAGAIPTGNMTSAAATAKFRWVLARVDAEIAQGSIRADDRVKRVQELMAKKYVGEEGNTTDSFTEEESR